MITVTIKDANGLTGETLSLGAQAAGVHNFTWDGTTDDGRKAADGSYTISLKATRGGETKVSATALASPPCVTSRRQRRRFHAGPRQSGLATMDDVKQIFDGRR